MGSSATRSVDFTFKKQKGGGGGDNESNNVLASLSVCLSVCLCVTSVNCPTKFNILICQIPTPQKKELENTRTQKHKT